MKPSRFLGRSLAVMAALAVAVLVPVAAAAAAPGADLGTLAAAAVGAFSLDVVTPNADLISMAMIVPTVGRKVWYWPSAYDKAGPGGMLQATGQPLDATVVCVHSERMVNLLVLDVNANAHKRTSVMLKQGDEFDRINPGDAHAEWMPYQVGQAKAAEPAT